MRLLTRINSSGATTSSRDMSHRNLFRQTTETTAESKSRATQSRPLLFAPGTPGAWRFESIKRIKKSGPVAKIAIHPKTKGWRHREPRRGGHILSKTWPHRFWRAKNTRKDASLPTAFTSSLIAKCPPPSIRSFFIYIAPVTSMARRSAKQTTIPTTSAFWALASASPILFTTVSLSPLTGKIALTNWYNSPK